MDEAMQVADLIKLLEKMDPNALLFVERTGEFRPLTATDVSEQEWSEDDGILDDCGEPIICPCVLISAWD